MKNKFLSAFLEQKNSEKALHLSKFFKTGKGQYGEGDVFLGLAVPQTRAIVKEFYRKCSVDDISDILHSPYHEIRLGALLMLAEKYKRAEQSKKQKIYATYINNVDYINNWDLVDLTAPNIVGDYVYNYGSTDDMWKLANSSHLWSERISIVAGLYFIRQKEFRYMLDVCKHFMTHKHDLIHKATGWMLREVGKRDENMLCEFLNENAQYMPRTALRYAIEKFDEKKRKSYLAIKKVC